MLVELRAASGIGPAPHANPRSWSKGILANAALMRERGWPVQQVDEFPKNLPVLKHLAEKFPGFGWEVVTSTRFPERRSVRLYGLPSIRVSEGSFHPTLADLLLMKPGDIAVGGWDHPIAKRTRFGQYEMWISDERQNIPGAVVAAIHAALDMHIGRNTSSLIVRLDMAPVTTMQQGSPLPIYEVEAKPGISLALQLGPHLREPLRRLMDVAMLTPRYTPWRPAYDAFDIIDIPVHERWEDIPDNARIYVSCEEGEVPPDRRRQLVTDPFADKHICFPISGGRIIGPSDTLEQLQNEFLGGFAVKPLTGWGAREVVIYAPHDRHHGSTERAIRKVLESHAANDPLIVQPFYPPARNERFGSLIWRVYAVRDSVQEPFRLIGGMWNARTSKSLIVHGASDAVFGPLTV